MHLRKLNISYNEMTTVAAESIADILSHNLQLEKLELSYNFMQTAGVIKIFKSLIDISSFKKIHINGNMITDEAADDIAFILSQNTNLKELDISCNNLQAVGAIKIFQGIKGISTLTKFNIAHNMITDEAMEYIVNALSSNGKLTELNLSHNNFKNTITFKNLKIANVNKFNFSNNNINKTSTKFNGIALFKFLSRCTNLQVLDLSSTNLQDTGCIEMLNALDIYSLIKIDISNNGIQTHAADKIAVLLSKNDDLEELDLSCNHLQELGIRNVLDSLNILNLKKLNISNNHMYITSDPNHIGGILVSATTLTELDLSYNYLSARYIYCFLCQAEDIFMNLIKFNISGNDISDGAASTLGRVLSKSTKLKELNLSDINLDAEGVSKIFNWLRVSNLIKFSISHNNITDLEADYIAAFLSENTDLEELDLSHNKLQSAGAKSICRTNLSKLTHFNISHNNIKIEAANDIAAFLSSNAKLQVLDLSYNYLHAKIFSGIKHISNLISLDISHNIIIDEATEELATVLLHNFKLQELDFSYSNLSSSDAVNIFKGMKNITNLISFNISHNTINDEAADELATVLVHNFKLQELDFSYNNLSSPDAVKIFKGMKNITNLISFNISHNTINDEAADELATVLVHNFKLQELDFSYNNLSSPDAVKIFKGMKNITNLISFNISHNTIAADELASVLLHNSKIQQLCFSHNSSSTSDVLKNFKGMKNISNLSSLNINHNMITDEVAENVANVLFQNKHLQILDMSISCLKSKGCIKIFNGMINIFYLRKLDISHNEITSEAANIIAAALAQNIKLEELDISYNDLQSSGAIKIFQGIKYTETLMNLNIAHNKITEEATESIIYILQSNYELKHLNIRGSYKTRNTE